MDASLSRTAPVRRIRIVSCGPADDWLLECLTDNLPPELQCETILEPLSLDPEPFLHPERGQYHSTHMLSALPGTADGEIVVGVTPHDLYIPILTFVFGEAVMNGDRALVSYFRLRREVYGFPADREILLDRLVKEAVHEIGHVLGLVHCEDSSCVMARSHEVESIDVKNATFCPLCVVEVARGVGAEAQNFATKL